MEFLDNTDNDGTGRFNQLYSIIISTANGQQVPPRALPSTVIVIDSQSTLQARIADSLTEALVSSSRTLRCETISVGKMLDMEWKKKHCIFLNDIEGRIFLENIEQEGFKALQNMVADLDSILWLSQGGGPAPQNPSSELITGFARVARQENPLLKFITLSLEKIQDCQTVVDSSLSILDQVLRATADKNTVVDNSFHQTQDGLFHISRISEATEMNDLVIGASKQAAPKPGIFGGDPTRALKLTIGSRGLLDTLHFIEDESHGKPLLQGEVEYNVMAVGLNFLDVMVALDQVDGDMLGIEGAGVVTRTAPNSKFQVGDRVCGDGRCTFGTFARTNEDCLTKMPEEMSFTLAAGFGVVFMTAYVSLYEVADIQPGESVLIHAAAGGVGQACIQLAKLRGAEIYATVGSIRKRDHLVDHYGIPKDHIFSSKDLVFAQSIKRLTNGRGI